MCNLPEKRCVFNIMVIYHCLLLSVWFWQVLWYCFTRLKLNVTIILCAYCVPFMSIFCSSFFHFSFFKILVLTLSSVSDLWMLFSYCFIYFLRCLNCFNLLFPIHFRFLFIIVCMVCYFGKCLFRMEIHTATLEGVC